MLSKRVLIAEDAIDFARMLQATLATVDPSIKTVLVPSAEEAILEVGRLSPDVLISDIRLPGMSGIDLITRVHKRYPAMRIIAITGLKDPDLESKARAAGADYFFPKPLAIGDFIAAMQALLDLPPAAAAQPAQIAQAAHAAPVLPAASLPEPAALSASPARLSELLAALRQRVHAQAVLLIDDHGRVAARAGDLAQPAEEDGLPAWLAAASAVAKAARSLPGTAPAEGAMALRSAGLALILAPLGDRALVVALTPERSALHLAYTLDEVLHVQSELAASEAAPTLPIAPAETPMASAPAATQVAGEPAMPTAPTAESVESGEVDAELEQLFQQAPAAPAADASAFWEQAVESKSAESSSPDVISYEQAARLGLTPEDEP